MGVPKLKSKINVEDYLESEKNSAVKHEYIDGEVYTMAGGSDRHNLISGELYLLLANHLRNSRCQPFFGDLKVRVSESIYYYPDVLVSCEEEPDDPYFRNHPILIVEVVSPSTERIDRSEKLLYYLQMPSLREYAIVDQHKMNVELHRRQINGNWITYIFDAADDVVEFASVEMSVPLPDLYHRVQFQTNATKEH